MALERSYEHKHQGCFGKERFTRHEAQIAKRSIKSRKKHKGVTVYECIRCKHWHIGNNTWIASRPTEEP